MEIEQLKRIFEFLEDKEGKKLPEKWVNLMRQRKIIEKLVNGISLTEDELIIKSSLDLSFSKIASLPKGLKVWGFLDLAGTKVASLPEGLEVGSRLFIENTPLVEKYRDEEIREMIKPGFIIGQIVRI